MIDDRKTSRRVFNVFNYLFLGVIMVITLYPLYYQFIVSISNGLDVMRGEVTFLPQNITLDTYRQFLKGDLFMYMKNSIFYTVLGTFINLVMSSLCAYPLTRKQFSGRKFFTFMVTFTMFFSGGMVPLYLVVKELELLDTVWALVLPVAISTYNMIIIRTSFQAIPESLIESAQLDGANDVVILCRIVLPLSKAVLATMLLYYAVSHWNDYFNAMLYINSKELYPLQIMLRNMLIAGLFSEEAGVAGGSTTFSVTDATFTMFFSGGMVPLYLVVKELELLDTVWALVLPVAISTYNMIIIRTSFQAIPESLIESAQLDGANDVVILCRIVLPLSKAVLATMLLYYAVSHWNDYFNAMLYINSKELYPLQIMLRNMLIAGLFSEEAGVAGGSTTFSVTDATLRAAAIIVTTLPILVVYPFVQRYFVKGVMIGSVKG